MKDNEAMAMLRRHFIGGVILIAGFAVSLGLIALAPESLPKDDVAAFVAQCEEADAAAVAALKPLLEKSDRRTTLTIGASFGAIADARRACWHGQAERGLRLYGLAAMAMARHVASLPDYGD